MSMNRSPSVQWISRKFFWLSFLSNWAKRFWEMNTHRMFWITKTLRNQTMTLLDAIQWITFILGIMISSYVWENVACHKHAEKRRSLGGDFLADSSSPDMQAKSSDWDHYPPNMRRLSNASNRQLDRLRFCDDFASDIWVVEFVAR